MKTVVFCLPGKEYSGKFLQCWTYLFSECVKNNIQPVISQTYSPLLYYVRNMCLGGNILEGVEQKPFGGKLNYDYIMWIDSDMIFSPDDFFQLLNHKMDIVSGLYKLQNQKAYSTVERMDNNFFLKNGTFEFLTDEHLKNKTQPFEVDYTGFGWMLIKKGVFESLKYPWFQPQWIEMQNGEKLISDFAMEDVSFCKMIKEQGYKIFVDPKVILGHEKMIII